MLVLVEAGTFIHQSRHDGAPLVILCDEVGVDFTEQLADCTGGFQRVRQQVDEAPLHIADISSLPAQLVWRQLHEIGDAAGRELCPARQAEGEIVQGREANRAPLQLEFKWPAAHGEFT